MPPCRTTVSGLDGTQSVKIGPGDSSRHVKMRDRKSRGIGVH